MVSVENVLITWVIIFRRRNRWQGTVVGEWREWLISRNNWQVVKWTHLGDFLNQWWGGWCKWSFWGGQVEGQRLMDRVHLAWKSDDVFGLWYFLLVMFFSPCCIKLVQDVSLGDSRCLRISALVVMALCWRADFISTRNLILALCLCCIAWTWALFLEASCAQGAGCWLHWWHKGNADKICITSSSFIVKGLLAAVAGKLNCAASSLARDREPLGPRGTASVFHCKCAPNAGKATLGCFWEAKMLWI